MNIDEVSANNDVTRKLSMSKNWSVVSLRMSFHAKCPPCNAYRLNFASNWQAALTGQFINPDFNRYEKHRVWVVEATLETKERLHPHKKTLEQCCQHAIQKRRFYVDEDSRAIVMVDVYDANGRLVQFQEGHISQLPAFAVPWLGAHIIYDFKYLNYLTTHRIITKKQPIEFNMLAKNDKLFKPKNMKKVK